MVTIHLLECRLPISSSSGVQTGPSDLLLRKRMWPKCYDSTSENRLQKTGNSVLLTLSLMEVSEMHEGELSCQVLEQLIQAPSHE